jgi:hypothetical protein
MSRIPSHSHTRRATSVDNRSLATAFRKRVPVLRAILEPPVTSGASDDTAPTAVRAPVPLHRHFAGNRPLRILVVGDSVGVTFARGMRLWALAHGNAQVLDASRMWCPLGRKLPMSHGIGIQLPGSGCDDWGTRWANDVQRFDPDVVFVNYSVWEVAPRQLPGHADLVQPGTPQLDAWQLSEYQAAADVLSKRGAPVVWFTIPCENEPILHGSPLWYVNRRTIPALAASRRAVHVVDLDHELCARGPSHDYAGVHDARPDGTHFSDAGAVAVAKWVMPIVLGDAPNPDTVDERTGSPRLITRRAN